MLAVQQCVGAADDITRAPGVARLEYLATGLAVEGRGQVAPGRDEDAGIGGEDVALGREAVATGILLANRIIAPDQLACRGVDSVE